MTLHTSANLSTASLLCLMAILTGCSQNSARTSQLPSAPPPPNTVMTQDGQVYNSNQYQSSVSQSGIPQPVAGNPGYSDQMQDPDRTVSVRAPLVNLDVNRDSGSVHLNTPFVRINTFGRGHGAQIEIPRLRTNSDQVQPADDPSASGYPSR